MLNCPSVKAMSVKNFIRITQDQTAVRKKYDGIILLCNVIIFSLKMAGSQEHI